MTLTPQKALNKAFRRQSVNKDDLEEVVDGVCEDIEYVRKFLSGVDEIVAEVEKTDPELAKEIKDHFYNWYDEDEDYDMW